MTITNNEYRLLIEYYGNSPLISWLPYLDTIQYRVYRGLTDKDSDMSVIKTTDLLFYLDEAVEVFDKSDYVSWHYKISSIDADGNETFFTPTLSTSYEELAYPYEGVLNRIVSLNKLMLERIMGEPIIFYIKKGAGQRCPDCYDLITEDGRTDLPLCMTCFNTTFLDGYDKVDGWVKMRNAPGSILENIYGKVEQKDASGWTLPYPILKTGDMIRTKSGELYLIDTVNRKQQRGKGTIQMLNMKLLESGHPFYTIP